MTIPKQDIRIFQPRRQQPCLEEYFCRNPKGKVLIKCMSESLFDYNNSRINPQP